MDSLETTEMVALGRPFSLGMFYDCRRDQIIPGITLWDKEKLDKDKTVEPQPNTECKIVTSDSISDKSFSLDVSTSLKASFLGGLVKVKGSAKYLHDNKKSTKQARVTLQYKTTTVFKTLSMNQLGTGNLKHCDVMDKGSATHVVTGILYGAQAFFVFDKQISEDESVQDIQGNLQGIIEKIPKTCIKGRGALKMEETEIEKVNKFSCTFHGDFHLDKSPTTFEEAIKVYQDLPRLLGPNKENVVPVAVHLLPLSALDSKASKLVRQISVELVTKAQNILENLSELEMWCNDVMNSPEGQNFSQLSERIKSFKGLCSQFKLRLQGTLAQKLPSIRGGGEEESALAQVLTKAAESPFSRQSLDQWKRDKDKEVNTIKTLMTRLKNTETVSSENALTDKVCDSENALVFVLTSLGSTEPFLSELDQYLKESQSDSSDAPQPWYSSKDVIDSVRHKAKLFGDFAEANKDKDKQNIQFLAMGVEDKHHEGSAIYLYEDGFKVSEDFALPSKPAAVSVGEVTHSTVSLLFSAPSEGVQSITGYRVEFCEEGQEEWNQQPQAEAGAVTVSDLSPDTEYSIRVRAVTAVGVGPAAAPKTSIRTSPGFEQPQRTMSSRDKDQLLRYVRNYKPKRVSHVRVLLYGPAGAGKSSFINSVSSAVTGRSVHVAEVNANASSTRSFTVEYKTHQVKLDQAKKIPIVFNDMMGLDPKGSRGVLPDDIILAMEGHMKDGYQFNPSSKLSNKSTYYNRNPTIDDMAHVLVCVLDANAPDFVKSFIRKMQKIGEAARYRGITQIAAVTHIDEIENDVKTVCKSQRLKDKMEMFSKIVGIPVMNIFPVRNNYEGEQKKEVEALLLTPLKHMLNYGDDFIDGQTKAT